MSHQQQVQKEEQSDVSFVVATTDYTSVKNVQKMKKETLGKTWFKVKKEKTNQNIIC